MKKKYLELKTKKLNLKAKKLKLFLKLLFKIISLPVIILLAYITLIFAIFSVYLWVELLLGNAVIKINNVEYHSITEIIMKTRG